VDADVIRLGQVCWVKLLNNLCPYVSSCRLVIAATLILISEPVSLLVHIRLELLPFEPHQLFLWNGQPGRLLAGNCESPAQRNHFLAVRPPRAKALNSPDGPELGGRIIRDRARAE